MEEKYVILQCSNVGRLCCLLLKQLGELSPALVLVPIPASPLEQH